MSSAIDPSLFRETLGNYPTGVAVVTAVGEDGNPVGMVVGTFSSASLDPPLVAFFPANSSWSFAQLRTADTFCVNVLASDQESLCRQLASGGAAKFDGVRWRPGPLGSPILDGVVSWIECTFSEILDAGDHSVVLGLVRELAVERPTLPLLFFQGGYGRFSPGSFVAAPDPDLIEAARLAEKIRSQVEDLGSEFGVDCTVLARVRNDAIQVLTASGRPMSEPSPLGHRQPIVPPMGAVFMVDSSPAEIDEWLRGGSNDSEELRAAHRAALDKVRECGYSLLLAPEPELLDRHRAALTAFESSDRLPRHERTVRQVTGELVELFCPDLVPGQLYDVSSIVVPLAGQADRPALALRMTGLPPAASTDQIDRWVQGLKRVADSTVRGLP